jgi:hypothetical protein
MTFVQAFLSYAHKDAEADKTLLDWLGKRLEHEVNAQLPGITFSIWRDEKLRTGDKWDAKIEAAIRASRILILPVSADLLESDYIRDQEVPIFREVEPELEGHAGAIFAIPIAKLNLSAHAPKPIRDFHVGLREYQWHGSQPFARMNDTERQAAIHRLADDIAGCVMKIIEMKPTVRPSSETQRQKPSGRRPEFTAEASNFADVDVVATRHVALRSTDTDKTSVQAQIGFLPRVYVQTKDGKRVEFGVRRAYLDITADAGVKLARSEHAMRSQKYLHRHDADGEITLQLNPRSDQHTLGEQVLDPGPAPGENFNSEVALAPPDIPASCVQATLSYKLDCESLYLGPEAKPMGAQTKAMLGHILAVAATKAKLRPGTDGKITLPLEIEDQRT